LKRDTHSNWEIGQAISSKTSKVTITDFRIENIQLGGQGAPLVPIGDKLLFRNMIIVLILAELQISHLIKMKNALHSTYALPTNFLTTLAVKLANHLTKTEISHY